MLGVILLDLDPCITEDWHNTRVKIQGNHPLSSRLLGFWILET
jgi:hypothetical protein